MAAVLPPLIAAGGFGLYFLTSFRFARYRRVPWEFLAVVAAGAALGVYRLVAAPGDGTAIGAGLALGILVFACWFLFSFSMYGPREDRPRVGERFPDFTLPASDGSTFSLAAARGRRLLVLCYRGMPPSFITHRSADGASRDLFLSTTFLLDETGVIRWVHRPDTYRVRAPAREVLRAIDVLP